jgi:4-aminobutyrate aminotransferase-like enzyme/Ser/Thr protein kinase RdoA (MazF antagonist)
VLALRSAPPVFSPAEAERIALDLYGLALSVRPLPGERDGNFQAWSASGHQYVLKLFDVAADPLAADCQMRVLRHLAEQDSTLPVPRLHATMDGSDLGNVDRAGVGFATCLLSYLPGLLLTDCEPRDSLLLNVGRCLARLDRALKGFFHPALARHLAWDVRRLPALRQCCRCVGSVELRQQVERMIQVLEERMPALRGLSAQAIHGDCHGGNLLVDAAACRVTGVLDFGDMIHAPLILEPAVAMSELLTSGVATDPRTLAPLLEGYSQGRSLDDADVAALYDLITARHATTILVHAWRSQHDPVGAAVLASAAACAAGSLERLLRLGSDTLTREWHRVAGTAAAPSATIDMGRRHRLLGAGAELFYDQPLHIVRGEGVWLYDAEGRAYLDGYNNVPHVGHCHPAVVRAITRQTALLATHTRYLHDSVLTYAERLLARCPPHLDACIFVNSGSEANDVAWRIAQSATGHGGGMIMAHAYHGITDAVAALTPGAGQPRDPRVVTLSPPPEGLHAGGSLTGAQSTAAVLDVDRAVRTLAERGMAPAAFFIDSAMTSSGIYDPPPAWADAVTARIRAAGGLIVADEVQYGLGRSGSHFWGFERRGIVPDLVTLGKPMGNGYPMGAIIGRRPTIEAFQRRFGFFSTFGGNPVAACAGLAVLDVIERERLRENAAATGAYLRERLERLAAGQRCLGAVRGTGLLMGLEIRGEDGAAAKRHTRVIVNILASQARILIGSEGPAANILKLRPPLPFRPEQADLLVEAIGAAATEIDSQSATP